MKTFASENFMYGAQKHVNDIALVDIGGGKKTLKMLSDLDALQNIVKNVELTLKYELQYNMNKGIPYMQTIFKDATKVVLWSSYMQEAILGVQGVNGIAYFDLEFDAENSKVLFKAGLQTIYGEAIVYGESV